MKLHLDPPLAHLAFELALAALGLLALATVAYAQPAPRPDRGAMDDRAAVQADRERIKADKARLQADKDAGHLQAVAMDEAVLRADRATLRSDKYRAGMLASSDGGRR